MTIIKVTRGAVSVNEAHIHREGPGVVAIYLDLNSKRADILCTGSNGFPSVTLGANNETLHLDETKDPESLTEVEFTGYPGWRVFSADLARYTLAVCLVTDE